MGNPNPRSKKGLGCSPGVKNGETVFQGLVRVVVFFIFHKMYANNPQESFGNWFRVSGPVGGQKMGGIICVHFEKTRFSP